MSAKTSWILLSAPIACSAVLGLDEPTHRTDGGATGAAGASGGAAGNDTGTSGANPSSGGSSVTAAGGASVTGAGGANAAGAGGGTGGSSPDAGIARDGGIDAGRVGCQGLPLCDDFEGPAVGAPPDMVRWEIPPNAIVQLGIVIDGSVFWNGKQSLRVQGTANGVSNSTMFSNKAPLTLGSVRYVRLHAFIKDIVGTMGFMAMHDMKDPERYLVLGVSADALTYFFTLGPSLGQHVLPSEDAQLQASFHPTNSKWFCVETKLDTTNPSKPTIQTWVDGNAIAALAADGTPTPGIDDTWALMNFFQPDAYVGFGVWPGQGTSTVVYLDDVAVAATRIGCN